MHRQADKLHRKMGMTPPPTRNLIAHLEEETGMTLNLCRRLLGWTESLEKRLEGLDIEEAERLKKERSAEYSRWTNSTRRKMDGK